VKKDKKPEEDAKKKPAGDKEEIERLFKKGAKGWKSIEERYMLIDGTKLKYAKKEGDLKTKLAKFIELKEADIVDEGLKQGKYWIRIKGKGKINREIACKNKDSRDIWVKNLKAAAGTDKKPAEEPKKDKNKDDTKKTDKAAVADPKKPAEKPKEDTKKPAEKPKEKEDAKKSPPPKKDEKKADSDKEEKGKKDKDEKKSKSESEEEDDEDSEDDDDGEGDDEDDDDEGDDEDDEEEEDEDDEEEDEEEDDE